MSTNNYPKAGDIVEVPNYNGKIMKMVIEGPCNVELNEPLCNQAYSTFHNGKYVECSGGPAWFLDTTEMQPTDRTHTYTVWQWRDIPRRDGGINRQITVPVWTHKGWYKKAFVKADEACKICNGKGTINDPDQQFCNCIELVAGDPEGEWVLI